MLREIDTRTVDHGTGTTVSLYLDDEGFTVKLANPGADLSTVFIGSDYDGALDAFLHPFAITSVPNIWPARLCEATQNESELVPF